MLQSHYVVHSKESCDSQMGQGERAIVELPIEAGHLQDIGLRNRR